MLCATLFDGMLMFVASCAGCNGQHGQQGVCGQAAKVWWRIAAAAAGAPGSQE
jgi:hypothetical protein